MLTRIALYVSLFNIIYCHHCSYSVVKLLTFICAVIIILSSTMVYCRKLLPTVVLELWRIPSSHVIR